MGRKRKYQIGDRVGSFVITGYKKSRLLWKCTCLSCGERRQITTSNLKHGCRKVFNEGSPYLKSRRKFKTSTLFVWGKEQLTMSELARKLGISRQAVFFQLVKGYSPDRVVRFYKQRLRYPHQHYPLGELSL